jgi:glycosyltransferase involved in cell wall biosynthesis
LYKRSLCYAKGIFFQNIDDQELFLSLSIVPDVRRTLVVNGSGVDLSRYAVVPVPKTPSFLMLSRLISAKGVRDYADAAQTLKSRYPYIDFCLAGPRDSGPNALAPERLAAVVSGSVSYLGDLEDVRPALSNAGVFVLPSYYREGVPRSILEALAIGRPVITTDMPGCRETVRHGVNGFLVPPRSVDALVEAMEKFIINPNLMEAMGAASFELARNRYDVRVVNKQMLDAMGV